MINYYIPTWECYKCPKFLCTFLQYTTWFCKGQIKLKAFELHRTLYIYYMPMSEQSSTFLKILCTSEQIPKSYRKRKLLIPSHTQWVNIKFKFEWLMEKHPVWKFRSLAPKLNQCCNLVCAYQWRTGAGIPEQRKLGQPGLLFHSWNWILMHNFELHFSDNRKFILTSKVPTVDKGIFFYTDSKYNSNQSVLIDEL